MFPSKHKGCLAFILYTTSQITRLRMAGVEIMFMEHARWRHIPNRGAVATVSSAHSLFASNPPKQHL